jgi:1,4-alpha-glucan branching enzyme
MISRFSIALLGAGTALAVPRGRDMHHSHVHQARSVSTDGQRASLPLCRSNSQTNPTPSAVIVNLFEWSWNSVAAECTNFLGPAGYKIVQVSPATEHIQGNQWWTSYQKVSNLIQSKRGSRDEFRNMVSTCRNAGVNVIVDTIWNHMAGIDGGVGVAGSCK